MVLIVSRAGSKIGFRSTVLSSLQTDSKEPMTENPKPEQLPAELGSSDLAFEVRSVAAMTLDVFGESPVFRAANDPDTGQSYLVAEVAASGEDEELLRRADEWHRRLVAEIIPSATYSLSLQFEL
jgi:hypothetical protein